VTHWARPLIGRSWTPEFNCWGLVREACRRRWGVELPVIAIADADANNVRALKSAARVSGMRPAGAEGPEDGDIVVMTNARELHCGMVTRARFAGTSGFR